MTFCRGAALAGMVLLGLPMAARAQIDPFYVDLERDAALAAARGEARQAARLYRIACFGMLDEPIRLGACTARLAIQQAKAQDREGFDDSFSRLTTVEEAFQGWTLADLSSGERAELARAADALLPASSLEAIPSVAALAKSLREPTAPATAPSERGKRPRAIASSPSTVSPMGGDDESAVSGGDLDHPVEAGEARSPAAMPATAGEPGRPGASDRGILDAARDLLSGRPDRPALESTLAAVREIADREPGEPETARLAGDLAYRLADWPLCAEYYGRAGDPGPEQPLARFYMAVCLFETGQRESAAAILEPSAGQIRRSPFVESYLDRILPPSELP